MPILFSEIYEKAIPLFDDPKITQAYYENKIQFDKLMYSFLQDAIPMFNNPSSIGIRLSSFKEPIGTMEIFESNGEAVGENKIKFILDEAFEILDNSEYIFMANDSPVNGTLNIEDRSVIFDKIEDDAKYSIEQYYVGEFLDNFSGYNSHTSDGDNLITSQIKSILARMLVKVWAEGERNLLTDIRNILQDSDFQIYSNANSIRSKDAWVDQLDSEILQYQNKLAWNIRFLKGSKNIGRG